ncbi:sulfotransferase [Streptomonospora sediminis]
MGAVGTGIKRRVRLLGEALRPPRSAAAAAPAPTATPKPVPAGSTAPAAGAAKTAAGRKPPKRTVAFEYTVPPAPRHVESPVFVLSPVRSGSTLLRMLLNSHSRIRAPHELHLRTLEVTLTEGFSADSMAELGLDRLEIEHVLWDRLLHMELEHSGKDVIVDKTPGNVWVWERLHHAWPKAKFIFLLRHPEGIVSSLANRKHNTGTREQLEANVLKYVKPLEKARNTLDGHFLRYEDLTADPETATRDLCSYLEVEWEPEMLDYGEQEHGRFAPNLGDRSANIKSGRIQAARELETTDQLSPELTRFASLWGYS